MSFDEKHVLKIENSHQINNFIVSNRDKLVIRHHSAWTRSVFSAETTLLQKHKEPLSGQNHLGFIYETQLPPGYSLDLKEESLSSKFSTAQPCADSFYWQTSQKHIQDAIDYGIFDSKAFTGKVIGAVGAYRLQVLERAYDNGIISDKFEQKEMLLRLTQARIRSLQGLERLVNAYDYGSSPDANAHRIIECFEEYCTTLTILRDQVQKDLTALNVFDTEAQQKIQNQITADILNAERFRDDLINAFRNNTLDKNTLQNTVLAATGPDSVAHFIKLNMITALREAQEHNQNMTYSRKALSFSRGQFNSFCEDGLRIINEYQPDHHNPTLREHQGYYDEDDKSITLNFQHLGKNRQQIRQTLMAITQIEGKDVIAKAEETVGDENAFYIVTYRDGQNQKNPNKKIMHKLKTTRYTGWDVQDDKSHLPKRVFFWFWNFIIVGIIGGLIVDLLPNLWIGLRGREPNSFVSGLRLEFTPVCAEGTHFISLADRIKIPTVSLGAIVGRAVGSFFRNTLWEIRNGIKTTYKLARLQIVDHLISDYQIGHNPLPDESQLFDEIKDDLNTLSGEEKKLFIEIEALHQKAGVREFSKIEPSEIVSRHAHAPYELHPGEWSDALNSALNGAKFIVESITHEVHAKNPFAALLFNFFYIAGGLAILAPQYVSFMGKTFLQFSKAIADASSTEPFAGAISSAFYEAYMASTISELITSGRNSGLISALTSLEDQPSSFMIYGTLAVGLGWFLGNVVNIPGVSDGILEELGTVPAITYGAAGAKFGLILLEIFTVEPGEADSEHKIKREKLRHFFKTEYPEFDEKKVESLIDDLLNQTLALHANSEYKEAMHRLQFFMTLQTHQQFLPNLSNLKKRQLIEVMRRQERHDPHLVAAMEQMLFPESNKSILGITTHIVFGYVFALVRCLASIVTWNTQPFRYLFIEKVPKDLARIYHAIHNKILNTFFNYVRAMGRGLCDIVLNEIIARSEGFIRSTHHTVSRGSYTISTYFDRAFATSREFFARILGIDPLRKAVTNPHAYTVLQRFYHKFRFGYYARNETTQLPNDDKPLLPLLTSATVSHTAATDSTSNYYTRPRLPLNRTKQLLKKASTNPRDVPQVIRAFLSEEKSCEEFFKRHFVVGNPSNVFYNALKNATLNYEILVEIIQANLELDNTQLEFTREQLIQLICLDRSGNIVVDLLTDKFNPQFNRNFIESPEFLSSVIKQFYSNINVLSHLVIKPMSPLSSNFVEAVAIAYEELFQIEPEAAFRMLSALLDNAGTQKAMIEYFNDRSKFDMLAMMLQTQSSPQIESCVEKLRSQLDSLKSKKDLGCEDLTKGVTFIASEPTEKQKILPRKNAALFKSHQHDGLIFFSHSPYSRIPLTTPQVQRKPTEISFSRGNK